MSGGSNGDIRSDHCLASHINMSVIYQSQVEVGIDMISEVSVVSAPVRSKRRFNVAPFPQLGKHCLLTWSPELLVMGSGLVVIIELFQTVKLFFHNLFVGTEDRAVPPPF